MKQKTKHIRRLFSANYETLFRKYAIKHSIYIINNRKNVVILRPKLNVDKKEEKHI